MPDNVCPLCGKDDALQKVSSIVSHGTSTGHFSGPSSSVVAVGGKWGVAGGYTSLTGTSTTDLAKLLSPPPNPTKNAGVGFLGWIIAAPFVLFILIYLKLLSDYGPQWPYDLIPAAFTIPPLLIIYLDKSIKSKARERLPVWEEAMRRWASVYYCFRDDLVIDPNTGETSSPFSFREAFFSGI